jgi:hypothetical protein
VVLVSAQEPVELAEVLESGQRLLRRKEAQEVVQDQQVVRESGFPETVAAQVAARGRRPREEPAELVSGEVELESVRRLEVAQV